MRRPRFRIICCLCDKPIPQASDAYVLDEEWQRRFPQMIGILACNKCAVSNNQWKCRRSDGSFVDGHRRSTTQPETRDHDSWDHIPMQGTHVALVCLHPWSGLLQGAEEYLRYTVRRPGLDQEVAHESRTRSTDGTPRYQPTRYRPPLEPARPEHRCPAEALVAPDPVQQV